jgi:hypothetical protein
VWRRMEDAAAAAYGERRWRQEEETVTAKWTTEKEDEVTVTHVFLFSLFPV